MIYTYNQERIDEKIEFKIPPEAINVESYGWNGFISYVYRLPDYSTVTTIKLGGRTKSIISTIELKKVKSQYINNMTYLVLVNYDSCSDS